ncbi:MAG TPA: class II aldolase/adducin family protein [Anaerolineaceae bacterium]|jgi:rhamnose utilization protein RhaD (predicted bifunctional aldolase and dehydrogenase)
MTDSVLSQLVAMSRHLGDPAMDYAILGEGNTSARADADTFWVKASGVSLRTMEESGLVRVRFDRILEMLERDQLTDAEVRSGLEAARVDPAVRVAPSVETFLHAMMLQLEGVNFVGHTHPTAVNAVLCSQRAAESISQPIFPDQIVYCGLAPVYVPYTDPGLVLARAVRKAIEQYAKTWGQVPKVILMQNHGFIALGKTAADVENITAMGVKAARVLAGTFALGGPNFLTPAHAERIQNRPDEHYRKSIWGTR